MSVSTLTAAKVARNQAKAGIVAPALGGAPQDSKKTLSDALNAVAAYVPTEVIAAYTLALAVAIPEGADAPSKTGAEAVPTYLPMSWYLMFLGLTPLFVWLVFAVRTREEKGSLGAWREWPWWEALAACVAFTAWSAALPKSAFTQFEWYSSSSAAVVLMVVSGLLPLIGAVVAKR